MWAVNHKKGDVIASMFLPAAITMIFTQMTSVIASNIDGIITSRFLGSDAYSAVSLLGPMVDIILLAASFISIGGQIVCANQVGKGERDEASAVFSFSALFGIAVALFFVLLAIFSPEAMFRICGVDIDKRPELYEYMLRYLNGYLIGIPAVIMVQVLSPFVVMDNGKRLVTISSVVLCVVDVFGDLANVMLLRGGIFGMGIATSISMWIQLAVIMIYFTGQSRYFRVTLKALTLSHLEDIVKNGSLTFIKRLATILRDIATNRINLVVSVSMAAVAARGMQGDLNRLLFRIGIGIGLTLLAISSMYYGASDRGGVEKVFAYANKLSLVITGIVGAVMFVSAPFLSRIYTNDPEVIGLSVFSIRCMAVSLPMDSFAEIYQNYLQSIQNRKIANILCFSERLFIPVAMAYILGKAFGSKGVLASLAVGKLVLILMMFLFLCIRCKGIPRRLSDCMLLPEDFGGRTEDNLTAQIRTMEDVVRESERAQAFCREHHMDSRQAYRMALFVEEMAGNIVRHGKTRNRDGICVDYRLYADHGKISMSLRDYCEAFDPMKYYEVYREDESETNIGIRMVMGLAEDIRYINTFNSNCLMITLGNGEKIGE